MKKRIVTSLVAVACLIGTGIAEAQSRGGGGGGGGGGAMRGGGGASGGSWSGGGASGWHGGGGSWNGGGNNWHGGGNWNGGGNNWNGGSNWRGGGWNNGWHGGWNNGWNNGWRVGWNNGWRGCWNCGWNNAWWGWGAAGVGISFGFPGTWWWPGVAPAWGPAWGWNANPVQVVDQGQVVFIQRDQVADGAFTSAAPAQPAPAQPAPANQYWHYCIDPPGYFPQVQQCNSEWLKVVPNLNTRPAQAPQYQ